MADYEIEIQSHDSKALLKMVTEVTLSGYVNICNIFNETGLLSQEKLIWLA